MIKSEFKPLTLSFFWWNVEKNREKIILFIKFGCFILMTLHKKAATELMIKNKQKAQIERHGVTYS